MILMMLLMLTELLKLPEQLTTPTEPLLLLTKGTGLLVTMIQAQDQET